MKKKLVIPVILALVAALAFGGQVYAASPDQARNSETQGRLLRLRGVVVSVDANSATIVIKPHRGAQLTLVADDYTRYSGAAASLEEIEPGMQAGVAFRREQGGVVRLVGIITRRPLERYRGAVDSVSSEAGTLSITTREGEALVFHVDENTRYKGFQVTVNGLADIQPGMLAGIAALTTDEGELLARGIIVASPEDLPRFDVRVGGRVTVVSGDSFTIQNRQGEEVTFQVDENTRFRSRVGSVKKIDQLKEGMLVLVGGQELEDGSFMAKAVLVVERKP